MNSLSIKAKFTIVSLIAIAIIAFAAIENYSTLNTMIGQATTEQTSKQAVTVSSAATEASSNVQTVASAAKEAVGEARRAGEQM